MQPNGASDPTTAAERMLEVRALLASWLPAEGHHTRMIALAQDGPLTLVPILSSPATDAHSASEVTRMPPRVPRPRRSSRYGIYV
jgi:hypothetical protein